MTRKRKAVGLGIRQNGVRLANAGADGAYDFARAMSLVLHDRCDWDFYSGTGGDYEMKGMPGCKSAQMCVPDTNATKEGVGIFRLTQNATARYGMEGIACRFSSQSQMGFS